jgi:hypothetical protein
MMSTTAPTSKPYTGAGAAHDGTLAATVNFPQFAVTSSHLSMGFSWTGTPTGTLKLQHSFDGATWFDTPGAATEFTAQPAGGAGSVATNWYNMPGTLARIVYTRSAGTGTLNSHQAQAAG